MKKKERLLKKREKALRLKQYRMKQRNTYYRMGLVINNMWLKCSGLPLSLLDSGLYKPKFLKDSLVGTITAADLDKHISNIEIKNELY